MEQPPSMVFTGDLQDGSYWIPVENAPDEFVNEDFGELLSSLLTALVALSYLLTALPPLLPALPSLLTALPS
jgi:VIT1/CCC1 family predicted Fe2+/Mn2+ transporter